jgi:hypothetical protein
MYRYGVPVIKIAKGATAFGTYIKTCVPGRSGLFWTKNTMYICTQYGIQEKI